jgi:hypothetical protein
LIELVVVHEQDADNILLAGRNEVLLARRASEVAAKNLACASG